MHSRKRYKGANPKSQSPNPKETPKPQIPNSWFDAPLDFGEIEICLGFGFWDLELPSLDGLWFPKVSAAHPVINDSPVRDPAQIVDLVRRIWALVESRGLRPASERITTMRPCPITDRLILFDRRADYCPRGCADHRSRSRASDVAGGCGPEDRTSGGAPACTLPCRGFTGCNGQSTESQRRNGQ
jgi:hypothetical protein